MAKLVVYASPSDRAANMAPDDVEIRFVTQEQSELPAQLDNAYQPTNELAAPAIDANSFVSTVRTLADGTVVTDIEFNISEVPGALSYEIRYA